MLIADTTSASFGLPESSEPSRAANTIAQSFGTKRDVAKMLKMSVRSVDNYISAGCPVIKLSPRRCRFDMDEVKVWFKTQYGEQRRK
jgi:hypothetical protein